jgi:D-alanyl-lipoteichoic acid acyltransferase DltB (MBOAT superfamily)
MSNFKFPYFSRNIGEFWRKWHISLSTWFRDYLYIPLGGSQEGRLKSIRNIFIIFLVSGFWHGANWTFIFWGLFHSLLFLPTFIFNTNRKYTTSIIAENKLLPTPKEFVQVITTFLLVTVGWVFFRSESLLDSFNYVSIMIGEFDIPYEFRSKLVYIFLFLILEYFIRNKPRLNFFNNNEIYNSDVIVNSVLIVITIIYFGRINVQFIYFNF